MKILLCCDLPWVDPKFGATRVTLDLAEGLRENGVNPDYYPPVNNNFSRPNYASGLAEYLRENASRYDVIDYPYHVHSWVKETPGAERLLKVTRITLLAQQRGAIPIPHAPVTLVSSGKAVLRKLLGRTPPPLHTAEMEAHMRRNLSEADVITVGNTMDRSRLGELGYPEDKIAVLPYGLTREGFQRFDAVREAVGVKRERIIAFVGTFDFRKGCLDFPEIVERVLTAFPDTRFRLLGTKGMFQTREKVLARLPRRLRGSLDIYPTFDPQELPGLLAECQAGMFPSYWEGFGIAVVEMLAAGLPVVAYDTPGPCDILPAEWLRPAGDVQGMAAQLVSLLRNAGTPENSQHAVAASRRFDWTAIAADTLAMYRRELARIRS